MLQRFVGSDRVRIDVGDAIIDRSSGTYSDVSAGDVCALIGSTDAIEIACGRIAAAAWHGGERSCDQARRRRLRRPEAV